MATSRETFGRRARPGGFATPAFGPGPVREMARTTGFADSAGTA